MSTLAIQRFLRQAAWQVPPALLVLCLTTALLIPEPLSRSSIAIAAPIPTPTAGVPTLLTPPAVNPVPFPGAQNQELLSGQYNTNFYSLWNYVTLLATTLNGCSYVPGGAFSSVSYTYPVAATAGACSPGAGSLLTLSLAHGDYDDVANAQTITGAKTFSAAIAAPSLNVSGLVTTGSLTTGSLTIGSSVPTTLVLNGAFSGTYPVFGNSGEGGVNLQDASSSSLGFRFFKYNGSSLVQTLQLDNSGNLTALGAIAAPSATITNAFLTSATLTGGLTMTTAAPILKGSTGTYPYVQNDYNGGEHITHGIVTAGSSGIAVSGLGFTSNTSYDCGFGSTTGANIWYLRNSGAQFTIYSSAGSPPVSYFCVGN